MTQYINKSALVAEIEKLQLCTMDEHMNFYSAEAQGEYNALSKLESFLDTLEVKEIDETIKNTEDHAYFAGSENTRGKLIDKACKWWEVELTFPSMTPEEFKLYKSKVRRFRKDMEDET